MSLDVCPSFVTRLTCNTTFTPVVTEAFYGIKRLPSTECLFKYLIFFSKIHLDFN